jgi:hypothetical protein
MAPACVPAGACASAHGRVAPARGGLGLGAVYRGKGEAETPRRSAVHHEDVEASIRRKDARMPRGRHGRSARTTRGARRRRQLLSFYST